MGGSWTVFKRELRHYLQSPATYVALSFFFLLAGALFVLVVGEFTAASAKAMESATAAKDAPPLNVTESVLTQLFQLLNFLMLLVVPMLTMRLIAEEKKSGAFELLVSTPLRDRDILLGKFFAALTIGLFMLLVSAIYPLILSIWSDPEGPVIWTCYLGLFLIITAYTAFGVFSSSVSENQIVAGVLAFVGLLLFQAIDWLFKAGRLGTVAGALSMKKHSDNFTLGIVSLVDIVYFLLFTFFFLFLTAQVLDARRWRA